MRLLGAEILKMRRRQATYACQISRRESQERRQLVVAPVDTFESRVSISVGSPSLTLFAQSTKISHYSRSSAKTDSPSGHTKYSSEKSTS